jgi:hypothetical protein
MGFGPFRVKAKFGELNIANAIAPKSLPHWFNLRFDATTSRGARLPHSALYPAKRARARTAGEPCAGVDQPGIHPTSRTHQRPS